MENKGLSRNRKNGFQLVFMIVLTCLSQVVALYKSRFTAVTFGATNYMDAYNYAVNIATFIFGFITTGVTTVIVPAYVKEKSSRTVNSFITTIYAAALIVTAVILVFRFPILELLTTKGDDFVNLVGRFLFIAFLIQGITAFLAVTTAYFQCINHYVIPKAVVLFSNIVVAAILISGVIHNIDVYLGLLVGGAAINLVFDVVIAIRLGFRYFPCVDIHDPEFKSMMLVFLPTLFSAGVYKIHTLVDTTIAANLIDGQLTILSYSTQIINMVNTVIIGNLTVYAYPKIVARLNQSDSKRFFWDYGILFHAAVGLLIAGFINIGYEGVYFIFYGGKFTLDNTYLLYLVSCVYIFGQQFNIVRDLVYRYFYANGNTTATLKNSIIVSITNIILSLILVQFLGLMGIVLGTILASLFSLVMIVIRFRKIYGLGIRFGGFLLECGKNLTALILSVTLVQLLKQYLVISNLFISIFMYGMITVLIYGAVMLLLRTRVRHITF